LPQGGENPLLQGERREFKKRNPRPKPGVSFLQPKESILAQNRYIRCLKAFRTLRNLKLYLIAFIKGFKTILLDGGEVYEDITSIVSGNETIALFFVEPLHTTFGHYNSPPLFLS